MSGLVSSSAQATDNLIARVNHEVTVTHKAERALHQPLTPWAHHHTQVALKHWTSHARLWTKREYSPVWIIKANFGPYSTEALCIANAESGLNPHAYNPSSAAGLFQLMHYWYGGESAYHWKFNPFDAWANAHHARLLFNYSGWSPWTGDPCVS